MTSSPRWTRPSMRRGRSRDRRPSPVADAPRRRRVDRLRAALLCAVRGTARGAGSRLRPLWVRVVLTTDYLLPLHPERVSLPAVLAPELPPGRGRRYAVYSVLDAMLASAFDALEELELTLDALTATWTDDD